MRWGVGGFRTLGAFLGGSCLGMLVLILLGEVSDVNCGKIQVWWERRTDIFLFLSQRTPGLTSSFCDVRWSFANLVWSHSEILDVPITKRTCVKVRYVSGKFTKGRAS